MNDEAMKLGFLGCGQMARAMAAGFVRAGVCPAHRIHGSDPFEPAREEFVSAIGAAAFRDNRELVRRSNVLILAIKPQSMPQVLDEIREEVTDEHCIVSIAAGVSIGRIASALGQSRRIVRVMPNTACLVGASASAYSLSEAATAADAKLVRRLLESVGMAFELPEIQLHAATGLSGSGPAFVLLILEAMADGGVRAGLPRNVAQQLAAQTILGAAKLCLDLNEHPARLKDMVASPAGTTIEGLATMESRGVRGALIDAVSAAAMRAQALDRMSSER